MLRALPALPALALVLALGCQPAKPDAGIPAAVDAGTLAAAEPSVDDDKPVYPVTADPPDPVAQRYCALAFERAEEKRKACCPKSTFSPVLLTSECVRTLSASLRAHSVTMSGPSLDLCALAIDEEAKQCDWGGELPASCTGLVTGTLDVGATCRSALECAAGLHCRGLGTTRPGKCAARAEVGQRCALAPDTLGAFIHQETETRHPVCAGHCKLGRCTAFVAAGGACAETLECGPGARCQSGQCTAAPFPVAGESCAQSACATGLRCVAKVCAAPARLGEACKGDDACRSGACEKGRCVLSCEAIRRKAP